METARSTNGSNENTAAALESARDVASETSSSPLGKAPFPTARTYAESLAGPVVLAQPHVVGASAPVARIGKTESGTTSGAVKPALDVLKTALTSAQAAVSGGYRTVSGSADEFVQESPWNSIAYAALGGIIIGMLLARRERRAETAG